jgi:hypothetical protein
VILDIAPPRDVDDAIDLRPDAVEGRIVEALAESPLEFIARQLDVALAFADSGSHVGLALVTHGATLSFETK